MIGGGRRRLMMRNCCICRTFYLGREYNKSTVHFIATKSLETDLGPGFIGETQEVGRVVT